MTKNKLPPILLITTTLVVYLLTMPHSLSWSYWGTDAGELIATVYTWGIPHPPGTPLFVLVGQIFRHLPLKLVSAVPNWLQQNPYPFDEAFKFNFMSAFFAAATVAIAYSVILKLTKSRLASFVGAFSLAFSQTFWQQAIVAEVLTLNVFLIALITYLLTTWYLTQERSTNRRFPTRKLMAAAFLFGLTLTNHTSAIMLAPPILFLIAATRPEVITRKNLRRALVFLLLGLSPYLYLLIRAQANPPINWGDPSNLKRLLDHITGKEYRYSLFFKFSWLLVDNFLRALVQLWESFNPLGIILGTIGLLLTKKDDLRSFLLFAIIFPTLFNINYNIVNITTYYLPVHFFFSIFVGLGAKETLHLKKAIESWLRRKRLRPLYSGVEFWQIGGALFLGLLLAVSLLNLPLKYRTIDRSKEVVAPEFGKELFKVLEPNAILITSGDIYTLSTMYFHHVKHPERTDLTILHNGLYHKFDWMLKNARRNWPHLNFPDHPIYQNNARRNWPHLTFPDHPIYQNESDALKALMDFIEANRAEHPIYLALDFPPPDVRFAQRTVFEDTYVIQSVGPVFRIMERVENPKH